MQYTQNYGLSQYQDNDVTSYLVNYNDDMKKIDAGMHANATEIDKHATDISALEKQFEDEHQEINSLIGDVSELQTTTSGLGDNVNGLGIRVTNAEAAIQKNAGDIATVADVGGHMYSGILSANEKTIAIPIGNVDTSLIWVDLYTSSYGINPENVELRNATGGQPALCIMTFPETYAYDVYCGVVVRKRG